MRTVVAVYTSRGNVEDFNKQFRKVLPDVRLINIVDDSVIPDIVAAGRVTPGVTKRLLHSFLYCGAPASLDAFHIAAAALPEIEALEKAAKRKRR
jgi:hypothetical protein